MPDERDNFIGNHPDPGLAGSSLADSAFLVPQGLVLKSHRERVRLISEVFKAMGQPTRLGIIELLQEREMTVSEIADRLGANMTNVSGHLSLLLRLGIVRGRKVGLTTPCTLAMPELGTFIRCVENRADRRVIGHEAISSGPEEAADQEEQRTSVSDARTNRRDFNPRKKP